MKILSIGNSFSTDAQRYVHKIAQLNGVPFKTVNLYIGGCPLRRHYLNILDDARAYDFQFNGESTGLPVSIKDALKCDVWDAVTIQQASPYSPRWETYEPYLNTISDYVKKYAPESKQMIHQTWAYSEEHNLAKGIAPSSYDMLCGIREAYRRAKDFISADGLIPSGEAMWALIQNGIAQPHRDGYHASLGAGRMTIGLLWFCYFTERDPYEVLLPDADVPITEEEKEIIRKSVADALKFKI